MLFPALIQHPKHGIRLSLATRPVPLLLVPLRHAHAHRNRTWSTAYPSRKRRTYQTLAADEKLHAPEGVRPGPVEIVKQKERFRILFMGRDEFSCLVLRQLYEAKDVWQEIVIATQPDVHVGRGGSVLAISPLKTLGQKLDIPVWTIPKVKKEFKTWELPPPFALPLPATGGPDVSPPAPPPAPPPPTHLLLTASFGRILPPRMLASFRPGQRLNVHPSLLPAYRGAAPIQWTIANGEKKTGVCVIEMMKRTEGIDAGGVWGREGVDVPSDATFETLRDRLAVLGGKLVVDVLRDMINGKATMLPQTASTLGINTSTTTTTSIPKAPLITAKDAYVDFERMTAEDVDRRFRGIGHQKPLYTYAPDGKALQLIELCPDDHDHDPSSDASTEDNTKTNAKANANPNPNPRGHTTFDKKRQSLLVRCAEGTVLRVSKVKPEGKSVRLAGEWWTGLGVVKRGEGKGGVVLGRGGGGGGGGIS